jgi:peptidoglycan/LPS O-acetylase OafA/YrhL
VALDGLRGIAMLLVILFHYLEPLHRNAKGWLHTALFPARLGWIGLDLFFVLSGFLIASILIANRESSTFFRTFYLRRFCRILPLYLIVVPVYYALHHLYFRQPAPSVVLFLTFTQNFWMAATGQFGVPLLGMTWSLAVEEQFYLLLPALVRFNPPRRLLMVVIGCMVLAPVLRYAFIALAGQPHGLFAAHVLLFTHLDTLMLGVLFARMRAHGIAIPRRLVRIVWVLSAAMLLFSGLQPPRTGVVVPPVMYTLFNEVVVLFSASTFAIALDGGFRFLRWKPLTYVGLISYALYLTHQPLNWALHAALRWKDWTDVRLAAVSFVLSCIVAALSWELYEKRFVRYGHRFHYEPREKEKGAAFAAPETSTQTGLR